MSVELIQGAAAGVRRRRHPDARLHPAPALRSAWASGSGARAPRPTWSRKACRRWAACSLIVVVVVLFYLFRGAARARHHRPARDARSSSACLGAVDDYLNARTGEGIRARQKMLWLVVVARRRRLPDPVDLRDRQIAVPFVGAVASIRWLYVAFAAFAIVAAANGVNITDGLDGLAGGTLIFAFVALPAHRPAERADPAQPGLRCAR